MSKNIATIRNMIVVCDKEIIKYSKISTAIINGSINVFDKIPPDPKHWVSWCDKIIKSNTKQKKILKDKLIGL